MRKTDCLTVRMDSDLYATLRTLAKMENMTLAQYMRYLIRSEADRKRRRRGRHDHGIEGDIALAISAALMLIRRQADDVQDEILKDAQPIYEKFKKLFLTIESKKK